jgi:hypothetical protein
MKLVLRLKKRSLNLLLAVNQESKILGHLIILFNGQSACCLQVIAEASELFVLIEFSTVSKTTSPGKDGCDGVGGGRVALMNQPRDQLLII